MALFSVFGDENTVNPEVVLIENFDGDTAHEWTAGGKSYDFEWRLDASKFATRVDDNAYPVLNYIQAFPQAVFGRGSDELRSLGIHGKFDRKGYNWIDIIPVLAETGEDFEIPLPGRVQRLDLWLWGANFNFTLDAYVRDPTGIVRILNLGNLKFTGWKNLSAAVPAGIPQLVRGRLAGLTFVKFRLNTQPTDPVDDFYVYLDQFKIQTDTFESLYDGNELNNPQTVQELWNASSNN
jgi:hypothetical protein